VTKTNSGFNSDHTIRQHPWFAAKQFTCTIYTVSGKKWDQ